jgi:hypothetical protein
MQHPQDGIAFEVLEFDGENVDWCVDEAPSGSKIAA